MKIERKEYKYKKYLIHLLVAGAMAFSWATVGHVDHFLHGGGSPASITKSKSKTSKTRDQKTGETTLPLTNISDAQTKQAEPINSGSETKAPESTADKFKSTATRIIKKVLETPPATQTIAKHAQDTVPAVEKSSASLASSLASRIGVNINASKIDTNFIRKVEGSLTKGYVPMLGKSQSGVTVGDGVDLGQIHLSEFNSLPIDNALKGKLRPYIGLKQYKAKSFLKSHPLNITQDELTQLNAIAANKILVPLVAAYNKASPVSFFDLPAKAQTAIFSYAYQWGPNFGHKASARNLWHAYTTQNWQKARSILMSSKQYSTRRHQEAQLLNQL